MFARLPHLSEQDCTAWLILRRQIRQIISACRVGKSRFYGFLRTQFFFLILRKISPVFRQIATKFYKILTNLEFFPLKKNFYRIGDLRSFVAISNSCNLGVFFRQICISKKSWLTKKNTFSILLRQIWQSGKQWKFVAQLLKVKDMRTQVYLIILRICAEFVLLNAKQDKQHFLWIWHNLRHNFKILHVFRALKAHFSVPNF